MVTRVSGFTYAELDRLAREYGFSVAKTVRSRMYTHPSGAQLSLAPMKDEDDVAGYHLTAVRAAFSDYGILPYESFDMKMMPYLVRGRALTTA